MKQRRTRSGALRRVGHRGFTDRSTSMAFRMSMTTKLEEKIGATNATRSVRAGVAAIDRNAVEERRARVRSRRPHRYGRLFVLGRRTVRLRLRAACSPKQSRPRSKDERDAHESDLRNAPHHAARYIGIPSHAEKRHGP